MYLASKVQKRSNAPVPSQKLVPNVSKSRAIPPYVPGINPPGWPLISALLDIYKWSHSHAVEKREYVMGLELVLPQSRSHAVEKKGILKGLELSSLQTQTYFWLSLVLPKITSANSSQRLISVTSKFFVLLLTSKIHR